MKKKKKKKIVHWRGNAELKTICKLIVSTSGHPDKSYLGPVEGDKNE